MHHCIICYSLMKYNSKLCSSCYSKKYYISHRDKIRTSSKHWYSTNITRARKQRNKYRMNNREKVLAQKRKHYHANKSRLILISKKYREDNLIELREKHRIFRLKHKALIRERNKAYRLKNKEMLVKKKSKYYFANRDRLRVKSKVYRALNPKVSFECDRRKEDKKYGVNSIFTYEDWKAKLRKSKGICPRCKKKIGIDYLTIDHIISRSLAPKGYVYTIDDVQPLCYSCNSKKGRRNIRY